MKTILKLLKKSIWYVLAVFILLVIQVQLDLKLPEYTSGIINVGIQQNGIEDAVPDVIRDSELNKILILSENSEEISKHYKKIDVGDKEYIEKYVIVETESIYVLKEISSDDRETLSKLISKPMLINYFLTSDAEEVVKMRQQMNTGEESLDVDFNTMLPYLPKEAISEIVKNFEEVTKELEPSMLKQMNAAIVKSEYSVVGVDLEKMQTNYILIKGLIMIGIALLVMIIAIIIAYFSSRIGSSFSRDLRSEVTKKVMNFSNKEFEDFSTASLITRSTNDIQQIQMLVVMFTRIVLYAPLLGLGALSKVSSSDMSWVIAVAVSTILFLVIILLVIAMPKFKMLQKLIDKLNLISREILSGLPVIRAFANEKKEETRFDEANTNLMKTNLFVNRVMTVMMPTMILIMNGVSILIIWVGSKYVDLGTMQVGTLMAFISYTMQIIMAFLMLTIVSIMLPRALVSVKRISEIFNKEISVKETEEPKKLPSTTGSSIAFKDVYFRYPDANEDVLQEINFEIKPNTTVAFIGSTGSGKSTLVNLIPRFFDVTGGKILINGINIKDTSFKDLRSKIGFVPQKGVLFSGTIESNIAFGKNKMNKSEIEKSANIAQASEFINTLEKKYNNEISQGGTNVSGGQRQRLAIARALANNPDILIFDDSFSALDFKTDVKLRKALKSELKDKTVLIVASRIATIMDADEIIVLDKGRIVGKGKHKELLLNSEVYKEIAHSQLSEEELNNA